MYQVAFGVDSGSRVIVVIWINVYPYEYRALLYIYHTRSRQINVVEG